MKTIDLGEKIDKVSMADMVFDRIKHMIASGALQPGDRLPAEKEIADMLNVNRLTVRLALQKLAAMGIVETKVGSGTYVKEFSFTSFFSSFGDIAFSTATQNDIAELRRLIEVDSARMAAGRATEEDKALIQIKLNSYLAARKKLLKVKNPDRESAVFKNFVSADFAFHRQVCLASHNSLLYEIYLMTEQMIKDNITAESFERVFTDDEDFDNHAVICQGIVEGDPVKSRNAARAVLGIANEPGL